MFTVCPKCALTLVVTAADLRVAQGYVRCGRCSNVFNALNALSDERQHVQDEQAAPQQVQTPAPAVEAETEAAPEPEGDTPEEEELEFDPVATNVSDVFVEAQFDDAQSTGTFESIVLEGGAADEDVPETDGAPVPESEAEPDPDAELQHELQSLAQRIEAQSHRPVAQTLPKEVAATLQELEAADISDAEDDDADAGKAWMWRAGLAALVLLLVLQVLHHYRNDLAVNPQLNGMLTGVYEALGVSLEPRWDVGAYDVRQLGAMSDPQNSDRLIVRASIKNAASRPQPLPLLRVAVQDRYGNRIAARDVTAAAYAPRAARRASLASGERLDVEMRFVDPGDEAVGFEIDACLASLGGGVNCANR